MINILKEAHKRGYTLAEVAEETGYSKIHIQGMGKHWQGSIYFWEDIYSFFGLKLPLKDVFKLRFFKKNRLRQVMYAKKLSVEQISQLSGFAATTVRKVLRGDRVGRITKQKIEEVILNA